MDGVVLNCISYCIVLDTTPMNGGLARHHYVDVISLQ